MVAVASELVRECEELLPAEAGSEESVADRLMSLAAITGAIGGAVTGALLEVTVSAESLGAGGAIGAMIGSVLAAGAWHGLARVWAALGVRHDLDADTHPIVQCRIR